MFPHNEANFEVSRLESLSAYLQSLQGDDDAALARLTGKTDPEAIRLTLDILLNAKRYAEAAALISNSEPHERWCDKAVAAFVRHGDLASARQLLTWSKSLADRTTRRRCLLMFAIARYASTLSHRDASRPILPGDLTLHERKALQEAVEVLQPILLLVQSHECIDNELESEAVQLALHIFSLLGDHEQSLQLAKLLGTRRPIPLALAQFALQHRVPITEDLPDKLRTEHPDSFEAKLFAVMIEAEQPEKLPEVFQSAKHLVPQAISEHEREMLCQFLNDLGQQLGAESLQEVDTITSCLLSDDHTFRRLLRADRLLRARELEPAHALLEVMRDEHDLRWLQLYANYLLQIGDGTSATDYFAQASTLCPHPVLLRMTAAVAFEYGRLAIAAQALERIIEQVPHALGDLKHLAAVYIRQKFFAKAAQQFRALQELEPENLEHTVNYAGSLFQSGELDSSLQVYTSICASPDPPLRAVLGRAHVMKIMNRPQDAFDSLNTVRTRYWHRAEFVNALLELAFAAQREDVGHEALVQLQRLQAEGTAPPGILQTKSLDDLREQIRQYRERSDLMHQQVLQGQWPWLCADSLLGHVSYWGWRIRTQPLPWLEDDPIHSAQYAIYATNSFSVHRAEGISPTLEDIACPPRATPVVIDLTALMTLHRLGLLDQAAHYFGTCYIPTIYFAHAVKERERLIPHQLSQIQAMKAIKRALDTDAISVLDPPGTSAPHVCPYVHEYTLDHEESEHVYRLTDIIEVLYATGCISDSKHREFAAIERKPSGVDIDHPPLQCSDEVCIALSTLCTLSQFDVLEPVLDTFRVRLGTSDRDEVLANLRAITARDDVWQWHVELWDMVRNDHRFQQKPYTIPQEWQDDTEGIEVFIAGLFLAQQEGVPLLADDRLLQMTLLNQRPTERYAAFGTAQLLMGLGDNGLLSADQVADRYMQLIAWRYRFLIPPAAVLKTLADRFAAHPPGQLLVSVAHYVHDCMRDPGLFAGFEPTAPPVTLANRLFHKWSAVIAEFIMEVWADPKFSDENAEQLTYWAMRELLPSPPKTMGHNARVIVVLQQKMVMHNAMLYSCQMQDVSRAHRGIRLMAAGLGIRAEDYVGVVSEVIDVI
jgi:tetratricopeptide (TPR) repeat protein